MGAFDYPALPHKRRHGPQGYEDATTYRPWLRDEFAFRCVYCLLREQWGRVTGEYDVEHFRPQVNSPELGVTYDNLLYACHTCNLLKGVKELPDPTQVLTAETVRVNPDGSIEARSSEARRLIAIRGLDSDSYRRWRSIWMRNVELAAEYDQEHFRRLMGFPDDLPSLDHSPRANTRPEGVQQTWYAKRQRGELPDVY
jgi:5-methylcytosine-specific restriction endonuclease McrA